ncbi:MAG: 4Fe-4S binding protein [Holophaga sp.]|nr:4Fe-4S binding protein [Holophaga sp.]
MFLAVFVMLFLQTQQKGADHLGYPVKLFLDGDPLLALGTLLSAHALAAGFALSLVLVLLTLVLGRVFCGWACPMGTLHNLAGALRRWRGPQRVRGWFRVKYLLLVFLLAGSAVGLQLTGLFDPLSLLARHLALGPYPAFNYAVNSTMDAVYRVDQKTLNAVAQPVFDLLKNTVLAFQQPHFAQGALLSVLFLAILLLNLSERRFWCRYLCPLGALLGLLGRRALLKRETAEGCNACGICDRQCQGGMPASRENGWISSECLYCMACDDACPKNAVSFGFSRKPAPAALDLGRRRVLLAGGAGFAAVAVSRATPAFDRARANPDLLRPPGARPEPDFLARCVKCGECMKVCTTNGLQPTFLEAGLEGVWSPRLVPTRGYCEFSCTLCGQVCPTGAIQSLAPAEKAQWRIGTAMFDRGRCLPHAHATPCIVCEEVCPTPTKAIWFEEVVVHNRAGQAVTVKQPHVDLKLCIGCGICEAKCPISDRPAVHVTNIGETRSRQNQMLLDDSGGYGS